MAKIKTGLEILGMPVYISDDLPADTVVLGYPGKPKVRTVNIGQEKDSAFARIKKSILSWIRI